MGENNGMIFVVIGGVIVFSALIIFAQVFEIDIKDLFGGLNV